MKKFWIVAAAAVSLAGFCAPVLAHTNVSFGVYLGPPPVSYGPPPVVYVPAPVYHDARPPRVYHQPWPYYYTPPAPAFYHRRNPYHRW